jgi:PAS domain S-box-containing protein
VQDQPITMLQDMLLWNPCCMLMCKPDGVIFWANKSFIEWTGYTLNELKQRKWHDLLARSEELEDDIDQVQSLTDRNPTYSVKTQMQPKNSAPGWGTLYASRWPTQKATELIWMNWEPTRDGAAVALAHAVEAVRQQALAMTEMRAQIAALASRNPDEDWIIQTVRMAQKHKKTAVTLFLFALVSMGSMGFNNVIQMFQRMGFLPLPNVPVNVQPGQPSVYRDPIEPYGFGIAAIPRSIGYQVSAVTPGGLNVMWESNHDGTVRRAFGTGRPGSSRNGFLGTATGRGYDRADVSDEQVYGPPDQLRNLHDEPATTGGQIQWHGSIEPDGGSNF